jgi:hypothetical protein
VPSTLITTGVVVLAASLSGFIFSGYSMARRVEAFNQAEPPSMFHFVQSDVRKQRFLGRDIHLTDTRLPDGQNGLLVQYGDASISIPAHRLDIAGFESLAVYNEWVAVLAFSPIERGELAADWQQDPRTRMLVVSRQAGGYDDETWGSVRVRDWRGRLPAEHTARLELEKAGKPVPGPEVRLTSIEPIEERTWEWQAALHALPKAHVSRYRFKTDAVHGSAESPGMGWTLPAAGTSVLGLVLGAGLLMGGSVRRRV